MTKKELQQVWQSRKDEIARYESELAIHEAVVSGMPVGLPDEWPDDVARFKTADRARIVAECPADSLDLVINLQQRDKARGAIREVEFELRKCRNFMAAIEQQLPEADRSKPLNKAEAALTWLETKRLAGEITSYTFDETTLQQVGAIGSVAVTIERPDGTFKRRVLFVDDADNVTIVYSSKAM